MMDVAWSWQISGGGGRFLVAAAKNRKLELIKEKKKKKKCRQSRAGLSVPVKAVVAVVVCTV